MELELDTHPAYERLTRRGFDVAPFRDLRDACIAHQLGRQRADVQRTSGAVQFRLF